MDWFKGKSTGNHGFYHQIQGFPVNFPIIQFYETSIGSIFPMFDDTGSWFMATKGRWKTWTPGNYGGNVIEVTSWRHTWHLFGGVQKSLPIICKHVGGMNQQLWKYIYILNSRMTPRKMAMNYIMGKICWGKKYRNWVSCVQTNSINVEFLFSQYGVHMYVYNIYIYTVYIEYCDCQLSRSTTEYHPIECYAGLIQHWKWFTFGAILATSSLDLTVSQSEATAGANNSGLGAASAASAAASAAAAAAATAASASPESASASSKVKVRIKLRSQNWPEMCWKELKSSNQSMRTPKALHVISYP